MYSFHLFPKNHGFNKQSFLLIILNNAQKISIVLIQQTVKKLSLIDSLPLNHFYRYAIHFSFYSSHIFSCYPIRVFQFIFDEKLYFFRQPNSSLSYVFYLILSKQFNCAKCSNPALAGIIMKTLSA